MCCIHLCFHTYIAPTLIKVVITVPAGDDASGEDPGTPPPASQVSKGSAVAKKGTYSLSLEQEERVVEWLQANEFLWLRSSRDYTRKKAAWQEKANELDITLLHLEKWWKNTKDWYVKVRKGKSGQAAKRLTDRDRWLLSRLSFYSSKYTNRCTCIYVCMSHACLYELPPGDGQYRRVFIHSYPCNVSLHTPTHPVPCHCMYVWGNIFTYLNFNVIFQNTYCPHLNCESLTQVYGHYNN